jgi:hypothetical protein
MWYGKGFNDGPEESEIEKRLRKWEERERQREKDENFSMTGSYAGGNRDDN